MNGSVSAPSAVNTLRQFSLVPPLPAKVMVAESHVEPTAAHVASQLAPSAPRCQHKPPTAAPPLPHGVGVTVGVSVAVSIGVAVAVSAGLVAVDVALAAAVGVAVAKFGFLSSAFDTAGRQIVRPEGTTTGILSGSHCAYAAVP